MSARDEILSRVRDAVADVTTPPRASTGTTSTVGAPGSVGTAGTADGAGTAGSADGADRAEQAEGLSRGETLDLFAETVADYRATVVRATGEEVPGVLADVLSGLGCRSLVVPSGLDPAWLGRLPDTVATVPESEATSHRQLDAVDAVVTTATVGIAVTGTIVLDHAARQGRRELTLVPDTHVCVVAERDVVHDVSDAVTRLRPTPGSARPLTWISGPSATSDIELQRVEGVHGPRTLVVVIMADPTGTSGADAGAAQGRGH
ncbi:MAG TPA: LUD domain-containing protein [Humibacillus xanthopallidus]|nr:LUD domain-containing protein [Humibacillus xanthopallidus]